MTQTTVGQGGGVGRRAGTVTETDFSPPPPRTRRFVRPTLHAPDR
jgi:hypothetical protein